MRIVLIFLSTFFSSSLLAQDFLGKWIVDNIAASHISNLTADEANAFIGLKLNYQKNEASSGLKTCSAVSYRKELFSERELHSYHKVFFSNLGIQEIKKVSNIEIFCKDQPWYQFGALLIHANTKLFVSYSGYVFELRRVST